MRTEEEIIEILADLCHEQWCGWMKYLFSKCQAPIHHTQGGVVIPPDLFERWGRQIRTPYNELPENEKDSDRIEARKILKVLNHPRRRENDD